MPEKTEKTLFSEALITSQRCIPYIPLLKVLCGSVIASLIFQQLEYWFSFQMDSIYKFLAPCGHSLYRVGDSWTEELSLTAYEFRNGFDKIGVRYKSKGELEKHLNKKQDHFQNKFYYSVVDVKKGLTYYWRNHERVEEVLKAMFLNNRRKKRTQPIDNYRDQESESPGMKKLNFQGLRKLIPRNKETSSPYIRTKMTTEITTKEAAVIGERKETNANACHGQQNNAAASFVVTDLSKKEPTELADAIIAKTLTRKQLLAIQSVVSGWGVSEPEVAALTTAVEKTILDLNQFKFAGENFRFKLNTLKKQYRVGAWIPNIEEQICAKQAEQEQERRAGQELLHRYHDLRQDNEVLTRLINVSQAPSERLSLQETKAKNDEQLASLAKAVKQLKNNQKERKALC
jgi:hypothetical protein